MKGLDAQINRQATAGAERIKAAGQTLRDGLDKAMPKLNKLKMKLQRDNARAIADRGKKGIDGELARIELGTIGGGMGAKAIKRRLARAAEGVKRGSKPAQKAQSIYMNQLAGGWPGGASKAKNNAKPGPRNASPPPKKRSRRKK